MKYELTSTSCHWDSNEVLTYYPELQKLNVFIEGKSAYINSDNLEKTLLDISNCCHQYKFVVNMSNNRIEIYDDYRE